MSGRESECTLFHYLRGRNSVPRVKRRFLQARPCYPGHLERPLGLRASVQRLEQPENARETGFSGQLRASAGQNHGGRMPRPKTTKHVRAWRQRRRAKRTFQPRDKVSHVKTLCPNSSRRTLHPPRPGIWNPPEGSKASLFLGNRRNTNPGRIESEALHLPVGKKKKAQQQ